jgi:hypothetical protein
MIEPTQLEKFHNCYYFIYFTLRRRCERRRDERREVVVVVVVVVVFDGDDAGEPMLSAIASNNEVLRGVGLSILPG